MIKKILTDLFNSGTYGRRIEGFRILLPLAILYLYQHPWELYANIPLNLWNPPGFAKYLMPTPLTLEQIVLLKHCLSTSLILLSCGFLSRLSALIAATALFILSAAWHAIFYYDHSANQIVLALFILALTPNLSGRLSLDYYLFKKHTTEKKNENAVWPVRLIQFLFFFTFFAAGISKLVNSGWAWAEAENMLSKWGWTSIAFKEHIIWSGQMSVHNFVVQQRELAGVLGWTALLLELSSPVYFIFKRLTALGAVLLALFQTGIWLIMFFSFNYFFPLYLIFFPYEKIIERAQFYYLRYCSKT